MKKLVNFWTTCKIIFQSSAMMILLHSALVGPQSCASVSPGNHVLKETLKRKNPEWSSNDAEGSLEGTEEKERSLRRHVSPIPKHRVDWIVRDMVFCVLLQKEELRSESRSLKRRFSYSHSYTTTSFCSSRQHANHQTQPKCKRQPAKRQAAWHSSQLQNLKTAVL